MSRLAFPACAAVAFVLGCGDRPSFTAPDRATGTPSRGISDGAHDDGVNPSNDDFFFLPPMVKEPVGNPNYKDDPFHTAMNPSVVICLLNDAGTGCVPGPAFKTFASGQVSVSPTGEHYQANWDTKNPELNTDRLYRIQVFVGERRLGYADVDPVDSGRELRNVDTDEYIGLVDGRTLPIRFRIEHGALCEFEPCTEVIVTRSEGGTFFAADQGAAIDIPPDALPVESVVLTIERIPVPPGQNCVSDAGATGFVLQQREGCYRLETDPDLADHGGFQREVIVAVCPDPRIPAEVREFFEIVKFDADRGITRLASVAAPFLECDDFTGTSTSTGFLDLTRDRVGLLARGLTRLVSPRPLFALDGGLGCLLPIGTDLSTFFWGMIVDATVTAGDGQTALIGTAVSPAPTLLLTTAHADSHHVVEPVDSVPVRFSVKSGGGMLMGPLADTLPFVDVLSDANGVATLPAGVTWLVGPTIGTNTLQAAGPFVDSTKIFTVEAIAPDLIISQLAISPSSPTTSDSITFTVGLKNVGNAPAESTHVRLARGDPGAGSVTFIAPSLAAGATTTFVYKAQLPAGSWTATAVADAHSRVPESNETNNVTTLMYAVTENAAIDFVALAGGGAFTCGLDSAGNAYCWGNNGSTGSPDFRLGVLTTAETCFSFDCSTTPVKVSPSLTDTAEFQKIYSGASHSCGLTSAGVAHCWGSNSAGQLGNGTTTSSASPVRVSTTQTFVELSLGGLFDGHSCGVTASSQLYCWGANGSGQLGDGTMTSRSTPVAISGPAGVSWKSVGAGTFHTCAVATHGTIYCWGLDGSGQLGNGTKSSSLTPDTLAIGGVTFRQVSAGDSHTCAVDNSDIAYCWGRNHVGQLGTGDSISTQSPVTVAAPSGVSFADVHAFGFGSCARTPGDVAYCWGRNELGQLGTGSTSTGTLCDQSGSLISCSLVPVPVTGGHLFQALGLDAKADHACGLTTAATGSDVYCWGRNGSGELGNGTKTSSATPVKVSKQ